MNRKKILILLAGAVVIIVTGVALLFVFVDPQVFRDRIREQAKTALNGREVAIGDISLDLWPGIGLEVESFAVKDKGPDAPILLSSEAVVLRVALFPLLDRRLAVNSIEVNSPYVRLVRTGEDKWNISDLVSPAEGDTVEAGPGADDKKAEKSKGGLRDFTIDSLTITDANIEVLDETTAGKQPLNVKVDMLEVEDIKENQASSINVSASFADRPGSLAIAGEAGPLLGKDIAKNITADLEVEFKKLDMPHLLTFAPPGSLPVNIKSGAMEGKILARGKPGEKLHFDVDMLFSGVSYTDAKEEWPVSGPANVKIKSAGSFESSTGKALIERGVISLPAGNIDFSGTYEKGKDESGPDLRMSAASKSIIIEKLLPLIPVASRPLNEAGLKTEGPMSFKVDLTSVPGKDPVLPAQIDITKASVVLPGSFRKEAGKPGKLSLETTSGKEEIRLEDIKMSLGPLDFQGDGHIRKDESLTADISLKSGKSDTQEVLAMFPSLSKYKMGGTMGLAIAVKGGLVKKETMEIILTRLDQTSESATFSANGRVKMTSPMNISFNLNAKTLNLDKVMPSSSKSGNGQASKKEAGQKGKKESPAASGYVINGKITADSVIYNKMEIRSIKASPVFNKDVLTVPDTSLTVFDAPVKGPIKLDFTGKNLKGDLDILTEGMPLERVIKRFTEFPSILTGNVFGGVNMTFEGTDSVTLTKTANGSGKIGMQKGVLKGMDLVDGLINQWAASKPVRNVVQKSLSPAIESNIGENTPFQDLITRLKIDKGRFHLEKTRLNISEGAAFLDGSVGMDKSVDINGVLKLNKATTDKLMKEARKWVEKQSGGSIRGGVLDVLLNDGRLVLPFSVSGLFPQLKLKLDSKTYSSVVEQNMKNQSAKDIIDKVVPKEQKDKAQKEVDKVKDDFQKKAEDAVGEEGKKLLEGMFPK